MGKTEDYTTVGIGSEIWTEIDKSTKEAINTNCMTEQLNGNSSHSCINYNISSLF